jgi:hypothetical protein
MRNIAIICSAIIGVSLVSFPAVAQQKTVKACQEEWRANKDANQAKGITEKAYVTQCRGGATAAKPAPAAEKKTEKKQAAKPPAENAQQKTVKACQQEWRANKAANQANGITEKAYVTQCRSGAATATAAPAPAPAPPPVAAPAKPAPQPARTATATTMGANQYSSEGQARFRCGAGTVVWANLNSKIYHFAGHKDYGGTKSGAYMCEQDATSQGMRAAKNEKHP